MLCVDTHGKEVFCLPPFFLVCGGACVNLTSVEPSCILPKSIFAAVTPREISRALAVRGSWLGGTLIPPNNACCCRMSTLRWVACCMCSLVFDITFFFVLDLSTYRSFDAGTRVVLEACHIKSVLPWVPLHLRNFCHDAAGKKQKYPSPPVVLIFATGLLCKKNQLKTHLAVDTRTKRSDQESRMGWRCLAYIPPRL